MNLQHLFSGILISGALLLNSCGNKTVAYDDAVSRIVASNNPGFLVSVNIADMLKEGGISTKENIPMVAQMLFADKMNYLADPSKAGLDLSGKSYMGISANEKGSVVWMIAKVGDKEKFEKVLKDEGNDKFTELEGYNTQTEGDATMGWNEQLLLMVVAQGQDSKEIFKKVAKSISEEKKPSAGYEKFMAAKADVAFFTDFDGFAKIRKHLPEGGQSERDSKILDRMSEQMKGSSSMFTLNFENDKVVADIVNNYSSKLKAEMDFFSKDGTPKELLTMVGSGELNGFVSLNGNVQKGLDWVMKIVGEQDLFAEATAQSGLDVKRILQSLKGNIMFSFLGFIKKEIVNINEETGEEMKAFRKEPQVSLIATLNDNYLETIVDSAMKEKKKGNYYQVGSEWQPWFLSFRPGIVFYTNDEALAANTAPNAAPQLDEVAKQAMAKPISFYFNLGKIVASVDDNEMTQKIAKKLKYAYGGMDINGGHAELILNNGGKNALWTLINFGVEASASMQPQF